MDAKKIFKGLLDVAVRFLDSDHDGKVEFEDLPAVVENLAAQKAQGLALVHAAEAAAKGLISLAKGGRLTTGQQPITEEEMTAIWDKAEAPYIEAANIARKLLAEEE